MVRCILFDPEAVERSLEGGKDLLGWPRGWYVRDLVEDALGLGQNWPPQFGAAGSGDAELIYQKAGDRFDGYSSAREVYPGQSPTRG